MNARTILVAGLTAGALAVPAAASAVPDYVGTQTEVKGESFTRPVEVQGVTATRDPGLPVTGGDIAGMAMIGFGAVAIGTVLVRRGRTGAVTA